ncbi:hypothetical protein B0O99DRAFT_637853 [Bisporella sp. PMI_857]|nr:hypothetical protein B0O99DRAFT_637853 [Bisporella sp. PMI_857]
MIGRHSRVVIKSPDLAQEKPIRYFLGTDTRWAYKLVCTTLLNWCLRDALSREYLHSFRLSSNQPAPRPYPNAAILQHLSESKDISLLHSYHASNS